MSLMSLKRKLGVLSLFVRFSSSEVQLIEGEAGKSLADLVALNIGQMGENMALGHIDFFASPPGDQNVVFASAFCGSGSCGSLTIIGVLDPDP
jgi:hypothetical protein